MEERPFLYNNKMEHSIICNEQTGTSEIKAAKNISLTQNRKATVTELPLVDSIGKRTDVPFFE